MPKRPHNRPARPRQKPRRPASALQPAESTRADDSAIASSAGGVASAPTTAGTARPVSRGETVSTRRAPPARKAVTLTVNYDYLRRDIRSLAILAPAMVLLLVIAFFALH